MHTNIIVCIYFYIQMFKLSEKSELDKRTLMCDCIRYSQSETSTTNTPTSQIYIKKPREDSVISLLNSYLELNFDVSHAATCNRYVDNNDIRLVTLGPIALFSDYKLTNSSRKHLEDNDHAHIVSLVYKIKTSSKDSDDLSIGFDRRRDRRRRELTNMKFQKRNYHVPIMLKGIFGIAKHQQTGTFGLCYKLTMTRNTHNAVMNKDNAINNAKIKINAIEWYVPDYTPSFEQQNILMNQITKKKPTELHYPERSVFMKVMNTQNFWTFELGTQEGVTVPIWIYVVFQQNDRQHDQSLNNDIFYKMPVTSAQCIIENEKYPDSGNFLNYNDDDYSQGFGKIEDAFRALTKDNILEPYIS